MLLSLFSAQEPVLVVGTDKPGVSCLDDDFLFHAPRFLSKRAFLIRPDLPTGMPVGFSC